MLAGRCLTILWREIIQVLKPKELFAMNNLLPLVRSVVQAEEAKTDKSHSTPTEDWWVEYDLLEMFPNLRLDQVLTAVTWARGTAKEHHLQEWNQVFRVQKRPQKIG